MGLHQRYAAWLGDHEQPLLLAKEKEEEIRKQLSSLFDGMMKVLFRQQGSQFSVDILADDKVQNFIEAHAGVLDSAFEKVEMSDSMRRRLTRSNYIFSGMKTFHELNEAFPSIVDENGERKSFERFLNDVRRIDKTYNSNYLRAEYNFVVSSATMAAKWEEFMEDGDRYNLQYRTAKDDKVRPEHAALDGVTLPPSDSFWAEYYPPNGWNCRCTVVQVRKSKYPQTSHDDAMALGEEALQRDTKGIFHFNPGKEQKSFPDYNPYTIRRCNDCEVAKGKIKMDFVPSNLMCDGCRFIHECYNNLAKSETRVLKDHYMHEMEPLLSVHHTMQTGVKGNTIQVGFSKIGNEHLYSDTFGRFKVLRKEDLKTLDELLPGATYIDESDAVGHKYDIERFYYYEAILHGKKIRLNVAKEVKTKKTGQLRIRYFLYSINDIKE